MYEWQQTDYQFAAIRTSNIVLCTSNIVLRTSNIVLRTSFPLILSPFRRNTYLCRLYFWQAIYRDIGI